MVDWSVHPDFSQFWAIRSDSKPQNKRLGGCLDASLSWCRAITIVFDAVESKI